jgi:hypothetical protein
MKATCYLFLEDYPSIKCIDCTGYPELAVGKVGDGALAAAGIPGSTGQNVQYITNIISTRGLIAKATCVLFIKKDEMYLYVCSCSRESEK